MSVPQETLPPFRPLRIYAFDPSLSLDTETVTVNCITAKVTWEKDLAPGPAGAYVEVIDIDPASQSFYEPVNLNELGILAQSGFAPSEGNPKFHQQMVYAVSMVSIQNFENALGRKVQWASRKNPQTNADEYVPQLRIYPHAIREANAYYHPGKKALLFGYFPSQMANSRGNLPGGTVFSCLSFDIVSHETTHALLDGHNRRLAENTNKDALAFHEGFSDIVALLQRFKYPEVLEHQIANTKGEMRKENLLGKLAWQFGQATGEYGALREALGSTDEKGVWHEAKPSQDDLENASGPHKRGAVLVSAIFDAFATIYDIRTRDLIRIATGGSGILAPGAIHPDLVKRLAAEAALAAGQILTICIRALDYCPPVALTFGEYLRALITLDSDMVGEDALGYRIAIIEAFRKRGIFPVDVRTLSVESLRWRSPDFDGELPDDLKQTIRTLEKMWMHRGREVLTHLDSIGLTLNNEERLALEKDQVAMLLNDRAYNFMISSIAKRYVEKIVSDGLILENGLPNHTLGKYLGLVPMIALDVSQAVPTRRVMLNGSIRNEMLVRLVQTVYIDPDSRKAYDEETGFEVNLYDHELVKVKGVAPKKIPQGDIRLNNPFRGGCSLIINMDTDSVQYIVKKKLGSLQRLDEQMEHQKTTMKLGLRDTYGVREGNGSSNPFAIIHRGTASGELA